MSDLRYGRRLALRELIWGWLPPLLWMGLIFYLSAQPKLPSPPEPVLDLILKKGAHFGVYAVLAFLWWRALSQAKMSGWPALGLAFVITVAYSLSDEYHQSFVPGRQHALSDVLIDAVGAAVALGMIGWQQRRRG
ncbi:MAG: VanZ family protein [Anaerolineae bacterium]